MYLESGNTLVDKYILIIVRLHYTEIQQVEVQKQVIISFSLFKIEQNAGFTWQKIWKFFLFNENTQRTTNFVMYFRDILSRYDSGSDVGVLGTG